MYTWRPLRELDALRREFERAVELAGQEWPAVERFRTAFLPGRGARDYPLVNMSEDAERFYVKALAPGLEPEKLDISVVNDTLRIAGEKSALSSDIKPEAFHRNERGSGRFIRTVQLPMAVDSGEVSADYTNGLLTITLPKAEQAKPKRIEVNVA